jgi:hypothetical protein
MEQLMAGEGRWRVEKSLRESRLPSNEHQGAVRHATDQDLVSILQDVGVQQQTCRINAQNVIRVEQRQARCHAATQKQHGAVREQYRTRSESGQKGAGRSAAAIGHD